MSGRQKNPSQRDKSANRLFLISRCFVVLSSYGIAWMGIGFSVEISLIVSQLLFWIPIAVYLLIERINLFQLVPFRKISISTVGMLVLFAVFLIPVMAWINMISMIFVENTVAVLDQQVQGNSLIVNLLLMAVMPSVSEELMVRGVYFHQYKVSGIFKGALMSGIVFGMMHMNFNQFSYAVVLGMIMALLVEATGSIFSSMMVHFVFNGYSVVLTHLQSKAAYLGTEEIIQEITQGDMIDMLVSYTPTACIAAIIALGIFLWIVQHCKRTEHMKQIFVSNCSEEGKKIKVITPSFVIGMAFGIGYMLLTEWMV